MVYGLGIFLSQLVTAEVNQYLSREVGGPQLLSPRNYGLPVLRERCVSAAPIS